MGLILRSGNILSWRLLIEIISTAILSLPLIQVASVVSFKRVQHGPFRCAGNFDIFIEIDMVSC